MAKSYLYTAIHAVFNPYLIQRIQIITSFQPDIKYDVT